MEKTVFALAVCTAYALAAETPSVVLTSVSQAPDRTVSVAYTLSNGPSVVTAEVETNAGENVWVPLGDAHVSALAGDVNRIVRTDGAHAFVWQPDAALPDRAITSGLARITLTAWLTNDPPPYMAVSLAAVNTSLPADNDARLRFYPSVQAVPGGVVSNAEYCLNILLMRKISARSVVWSMGSCEADSYNVSSRYQPYEAKHVVTNGENYYMGVFPVTQGQWAAVVGKHDDISILSYGDYAYRRPTEKKTMARVRAGRFYYDSTVPETNDNYWPGPPHSDSFLGKLRTLSGIDFDLPGEAQWEWACRAGKGDGYWNDGSAIVRNSGGTVPGRTGGAAGTTPITSASDSMPYPPETAGTTLVGSYKPNGWGLYDMHGNIWELCLDLNPQGDIYNLGGRINAYFTNYYDNATGALVAVTPSSGTGAARFVTKGGCYSARWDYAIPGARRGGRGVINGDLTGFRVVCPTIFR